MHDTDAREMYQKMESRMDAMSKRMDYLQEQNDDLREENADLKRRVAQLEEVVDPDPGSKDYDKLDKPEKVRAVRKAVIRKALNGQNGPKGSMTYDEVLALFGNRPSAGHAYNLMKAAADLEGFAYDNAGTQGQGQKRVRVNLPAVKDDGLVQSVNNSKDAQATA